MMFSLCTHVRTNKNYALRSENDALTPKHFGSRNSWFFFIYDYKTHCQLTSHIITGSLNIMNFLILRKLDIIDTMMFWYACADKTSYLCHEMWHVG